MFEQFWRMGLASNFDEWRDAMRMQQLPIFHTMYADRDGHIMYVYNAAPPVRAHGDHAYWNGVIPGDRSELIAERQDRAVRPAAAGDRSAERLGAELQRLAVDVDLSDGARSGEVRAVHRAAAEPHAAIAAQHPAAVGVGQDHARRLEGDEAVDAQRDRRSLRRRSRRRRAAERQRRRRKEAAEILAKWDRQGERPVDGAFLFLRFIQAAGNGFQNIGGYAVAADPRQPLTTPRGFADPAKAVALLEREARRLEAEYDTMHVDLGRRDSAAHAARWTCRATACPAALGAIRTIGTGPFVNGKAQIQGGDTFYAVIEFQKNGPPIGEALLGYGNWSRVGSKHVDDQLALASQKKMRPIMRAAAGDREEPGEPQGVLTVDWTQLRCDAAVPAR